jgi:antitoxin (DNA-binding transcriptional repressor) of toxin-antitoxin stability system
MKYHDIQEIQKNLLKLLEEIGDSHEEVMITRDGIAIAMILPCGNPKPAANKYPLRSMEIRISDDFDEAQPELWEALSE